MQARIETLQEKKLVGKGLKMSLANNKTMELWAEFAPEIKNIANRHPSEKISMHIYNELYFNDFNPTNEFENWAAVEVSDFSLFPKGLDTFLLQGGLYAVFDHKGFNTDTSIFQYIFMHWLPKSDYHLDNRPHFEILGEKYKNNDPDSEEEIWIPIKKK